MEQARERSIPVYYENIDQSTLAANYAEGANQLVLISTYRMDSRKTPHWVVVSGYDENCLYFHDPDLEVGPHPPSPKSSVRPSSATTCPSRATILPP